MNTSKNAAILQGLVLVKYLYNLGVSQSSQPRPIKASCLLSFHDAVENFMGLACDKEDVRLSRSSTFDKFFTDYENKTGKSISEKNEMNYLNTCRIALKHQGILPSDETVAKVKIDVSEFFEKNASIIFNISFEELSISDLVNYEKARDLLYASIEEKNRKSFDIAVCKCAEALYALISEYKKSISKDWDSKSFDFGNERTVEDAILRNDDRRNNDSRNKVRDFAGAYARMSQALTIIGCGIDYKKYTKFMMITPSVTMSMGGQAFYGNKNLSDITIEEFQFCYDFVIETALKLQEFEIDPDALTTTRTLKKVQAWEEEAQRLIAERERSQDNDASL